MAGQRIQELFLPNAADFVVKCAALSA